MATALPDLAWLDWTFLAVLAISVVVGLSRGLMFEVMSLAGWVVAYFAARWAAVDVARVLPVGEAGSAMNHAAGFAVAFIVALMAWALLSRLLRMALHATPLSVVDRVLGAAFGLFRGAVLLLAVATVVSFSPAVKSPTWQQSQGARWLDGLLQGLKPLLPAQVQGYLPA